MPGLFASVVGGGGGFCSVCLTVGAWAMVAPGGGRVGGGHGGVSIDGVVPRIFAADPCGPLECVAIG